MSNKYTFWLPTSCQRTIDMLTKRGHTVKFANDDPLKCDIAYFTGGEDIHPITYGQAILPTTKANLRRDRRELSLLRKLPYEMPKIGVGRGAQLLCVWSGGDLYQDVDNHVNAHDVITYHEYDCFLVPSAHHQMMKPHPDTSWIMWTAKEAHKVATDSEVTDVSKNHDFDDIEMCFFYNTNSLACQPHPEEEGYGEFTDKFFESIDYMFSKEIKDKKENTNTKQVS